MPSSETSLIIEDGNAVFHYLKEVPANFKQICHNMLSKKSDVVFGTDMYYPDSVKSVEHRRRGCAETLVLQGEFTKCPGDWQTFLTNDENKLQLIRLILRVCVMTRLQISTRTESLPLSQKDMLTLSSQMTSNNTP